MWADLLRAEAWLEKHSARTRIATAVSEAPLCCVWSMIARESWWVGATFGGSVGGSLFMTFRFVWHSSQRMMSLPSNVLRGDQAILDASRIFYSMKNGKRTSVTLLLRALTLFSEGKENHSFLETTDESSAESGRARPRSDKRGETPGGRYGTKETTTTTTTTTMMIKARYAAACIVAACIAVAAAADASAKNASCQAMADKLNARYAVGSSRFDAGGSTGQEARDKLSKWMETNGLLFTECVPKGYPDVVDGPCTDGFVMDHIAATWIGLTDRAKEMVEDGAFPAFPTAPFGGIGLVFDTSNPKSELLCISPTDSASAGRQPDAEGNPGCGPMKNDWNFGQDSKKPVYESYLKDKTNETALFEIGNFANAYVADVASWTSDKWWDAEKTWEDISCSKIIPAPELVSGLNWTAFTPSDTASMEACVTYTKDPTNFWNESATTKGRFTIFAALGQWDPAALANPGHSGAPILQQR